jgi:hypothetical protein
MGEEMSEREQDEGERSLGEESDGRSSNIKATVCNTSKLDAVYPFIPCYWLRYV